MIRDTKTLEYIVAGKICAILDQPLNSARLNQCGPDITDFFMRLTYREFAHLKKQHKLKTGDRNVSGM